MRILFGCEESQEMTKAFRAMGHEAYSCDILDCSGGHPEWHLKMDVVQALMSNDWDMFFYFPDCTYITVSGLHWNTRIPGRAQKTEDALQFVARLWNLAKSKGIKRLGFENPIGCISTRIVKDYNGNLIVCPDKVKGFKPVQIIQPYNFGENASKATCLWYVGLPVLKNSSYFEPRIVNGKKRWDNQTNSGQNKLAPGPERAKLRSKTYHGIATAMAEQWGSL